MLAGDEDCDDGNTANGDGCSSTCEVEEGWRTAIPVNPAANMLLATAEGRIAQFVRSNFAQSPTEGWDDQWMIVTSAIGIEVPKGG